jgi:hypothetical protein
MPCVRVYFRGQNKIHESTYFPKTFDSGSEYRVKIEKSNINQFGIGHINDLTTVNV